METYDDVEDLLHQELPDGRAEFGDQTDISEINRRSSVSLSAGSVEESDGDDSGTTENIIRFT